MAGRVGPSYAFVFLLLVFPGTKPGPSASEAVSLTTTPRWIPPVLSDHDSNTPPLVSFPRDWEVSPKEVIGSRVTTVSVRDEDHDALSFRLYQNEPVPDYTGFFSIDDKGIVRVAKNLSQLAGKEFMMGVEVFDGTIASKAEAKVIVSEHARRSFASGGPGGGWSPFSGRPPRPWPPPTPPEPRSPLESPPLLMVSRHWTLYENSPRGTVVAKDLVKDLTGHGVSLEIESPLKDFLAVKDSNGGLVVLKKELKGMAGEYNMTVRARNRFAFTEEHVHVTVVSAGGDREVYNVVPTRPGTSDNNDNNNSNNNNNYPVRPTLIEIRNGINTGIYSSSSTAKGGLDKPQEAKGSEPGSSALSLTLVPLVLLFTAGPLALVAFCSWRKHKRRRRKNGTKNMSSMSVLEKNISGISTSTDGGDTTGGDGGGGGGERARVGFGRKFGNSLREFAVLSFLQKRAISNKYEESVNNCQVMNMQERPSTDGNPDSGDNWEFPRHRLKILSILGEGCFGQVWKCEATGFQGLGSCNVAVKTLKENADERDRKDLIQELKVMKSLPKHPNVVTLLGCCTEKEPVFVILEYMAKGKLQSYLRSSRAKHSYDNLHGFSSSLTANDLIIFAYQIAKGMEFLSSNGIIHRDLAARNVLVREDKVCKVADFGFARDVANNHIYERKSNGQLPVRWMAPESLYDNLYTTKSDVWSFGVLLWEIVTLGAEPYAGMSAAEVTRRVREGYRLEKPTHCKREVYKVMCHCWEKNVEDRLSFTELVSALEALVLTEVEYIELDRFPYNTYYNVITNEDKENP